MKQTIWTTGGCASWYLDKHGNNTTLWPSFTFAFRQHDPRLRPGGVPNDRTARADKPDAVIATSPGGGSSMTDIKDKVAVITGAGSGIGRALAYELARRGAQLALCDVDAVGLAETARAGARHRRAGARPAPRRHRPRRRARATPTTSPRDFGSVNIVINNAGIAFTGDIEEMTFKHIERVMDVDFWGVVNGTKAFLPHLIASGDGHVVNISSLFGLLAVPGQSAYNAAKFAVRGFTEALRQEMLVAGHRSRSPACTPAASRPRSPATPARPTAWTPAALAAVLRQEAGQDLARVGRQDHPARGRRQPAARGRRPGRQGARRAGAAARPGYQRLCRYSSTRIGSCRATSAATEPSRAGPA